MAQQRYGVQIIRTTVYSGAVMADSEFDARQAVETKLEYVPDQLKQRVVADTITVLRLVDNVDAASNPDSKSPA